MLSYVIILLVILMIYISYRFYNSDESVFILPDYFDKPNYGIFYNPLIEDKRDFNIGHKVFFYGEKYYVVGIEYNNVYKSWVALHLSKTMNDVMYKDDGLVVDSREVKGVIKCQLIS